MTGIGKFEKNIIPFFLVILSAVLVPTVIPASPFDLCFEILALDLDVDATLAYYFSIFFLDDKSKS